MRRLASTVVAVAVAALAVAPAAASAAEQQSYAAGLTYATPAVVASAGDTLRFTNLDPVAQHDLDSDTPGLFDSGLIAAGQSELVPGFEKLPAGQYAFHCSLHSWMTGTIQVVPGGGGGAGVPDPFSVSSPDLGTTAPDPIDLSPQASVRPLGPGSWPVYGHDLGNTRDAGKGGPAPADVPNLGPAWSYFSPHGDFTGTPVVAKNTLIGVSSQGWVHA
ncbi:MAG: hypothetical protein QOE38_1342, partial [Thermoleophilaceae bacterium]|nr:hypothetical protein [Thermoleophilaceae bacterium]